MLYAGFLWDDLNVFLGLSQSYTCKALIICRFFMAPLKTFNIELGPLQRILDLS